MAGIGAMYAWAGFSAGLYRDRDSSRSSKLLSTTLLLSSMVSALCMALGVCRTCVCNACAG